MAPEVALVGMPLRTVPQRPPRQWAIGASRQGLSPDQLALALDAPAIICQTAVGADDTVARNGQCDRIGGACAGDRAGRAEGTDPLGKLGVGHRPSHRNRAELLPDAALECRPAHVEEKVKSFARLVHEADHLRQIIVEHGFVCGELGLGKAAGKVRLQFVVVVADQDGTDTRNAASDEHLTQSAFADRIGDGFGKDIDVSDRGHERHCIFGDHEVHRLAPSSGLMIEIAAGACVRTPQLAFKSRNVR